MKGTVKNKISQSPIIYCILYVLYVPAVYVFFLFGGECVDCYAP